MRRPLYSAACLAVLLAGCRTAQPPRPAAASHPAARAAEAPQTTVTPSGRTITIRQSDELDEYEDPVAPAARVARAAESDIFAGTARKTAKTTLVSGTAEEFDSVQALWSSLEPDEDMIHRDPPISHASTSRRVREERRRVSVVALLCAASREDDNDYHAILCDDPHATAPDERYCLNVEVSGLPRSGAYVARLTAARQQFSDILGGNLPGSRYAFYEPPIPVLVTGSLFYDIDHRPGAVGPSALRPDTAWEIHPVETIAER